MKTTSSLMMDELLTRLPVQAMDIVEFNHELDKDDITAGFVSDWWNMCRDLIKSIESF